MKHIFDGDMAKVLEALHPLLTQIEKEEGGFAFVAQLLYYIISTASAQNAKDAVDETLETLSRQIKEDVMTVLEQIEKKGARKIAANLLAKGVDEAIVVSCVELTREEVRQIKDELELD